MSEGKKKQGPKRNAIVRIAPAIKRDPVNPSDFLKYNAPFACEDCSHFDSDTESCTLGYNAANHRKSVLLRQYELSGSMAFCRFHEID